MKPRAKRKREAGRFGSAQQRRAIKRINTHAAWHLDAYHHLLTMPWSVLLGLLVAAYVAFNFLFAGLFLLQDGSIANAKPGSLADAFFFSVQTTATIGYGAMSPATLYANFLVTIEVLLGMTILAVSTGLVFARFSRPTARVMFSKVAVIVPHDGVPTLMFRVANQRRNQILEAQVSISLLRDEVSAEGMPMRRFHDLHATRSRSPAFALSWTVMHPITDASPLYGATSESLRGQQAEIIVGIVGMEETLLQTVQARHTYLVDEILWDQRFVDIISRTEDGPTIDYRLFHDTVAAEAARPRRMKA